MDAKNKQQEERIIQQISRHMFEQFGFMQQKVHQDSKVER